jgi:hypothetical protein
VVPAVSLMRRWHASAVDLALARTDFGRGASNEVARVLDFLPTFARLAGVRVPVDRVIDGFDIGPILQGGDARVPYDSFYYYPVLT